MGTRYALTNNRTIQVGALILFHLISLEHQVVLITRGISNLKKQGFKGITGSLLTSKHKTSGKILKTLKLKNRTEALPRIFHLLKAKNVSCRKSRVVLIL
jgi:hypothetical protein